MKEFFRAPTGTSPAPGFGVYIGPGGELPDGATLAGNWRCFLEPWLPDKDLRIDVDGLELIERLIDGWAAEPRNAGKAATGAGLFLGDLLTKALEQAHWRFLPNGYPDVRL